MDAVADIGATQSCCALLDQNGRLLAPESFENERFTGIGELVKSYLERRRASDRPTRAALAVPAAVVDDEVRLIRAGWSFSCRRLKADLGLKILSIVNDLEALCWGLPDYGPGSRQQIGAGRSMPSQAFGIVRTARELGVGGLVRHSDAWVPIQGLGGRALLAAADDQQAAVIEQIRREIGHCTAEHVLSLQGLVNLYRALSQLSGRGTARAMAVDVVSLAKRGEPLASKTLAMYFAFLASFASSLALSIGARGGIYVAGGIVPSVLGLMQKSAFREHFVGNGGSAAMLEQIPTFVLTEKTPALRGLRRILGFD